MCNPTHTQVSALYKRHVKESMGKEEADTAIAKEYTRQKEYLERSIEALKKRLQADSTMHQQDNLKVMQDNMSLIKEINELRKEQRNLRLATTEATQAASRSAAMRRRRTPRSARFKTAGGGPATGGGAGAGAGASAEGLINGNRAEIGALKAEIRRLEDAMVASRPVSRERPSHV